MTVVDKMRLKRLIIVEADEGTYFKLSTLTTKSKEGDSEGKEENSLLQFPCGFSPKGSRAGGLVLSVVVGPGRGGVAGGH